MDDLLTGDIRPVRRAPPPPRPQPRNDDLLVIQSVIDNDHQHFGNFGNSGYQTSQHNGLSRSASLPLTNGIGSQKKKPPPRPPPPKNNPSKKGHPHQDLNGPSNRHSVVGGLVGKLRGPPPSRPRPANTHGSYSNPSTPATEASLIDLSSPPGSPTTRSGSDGLSVNSFGSESSSGNQSSGFDDSFDPFGSIMENNAFSGGKEIGGSSFFTGTASSRSANTLPTKEVGVSSFFTGGCGSQPLQSASRAADDQDPFEMLARRTEAASLQSKANAAPVVELPKHGSPGTLPHPSAQPAAQILSNNKPKTKQSFKPTIIRTKLPVTSSQVESAGGTSASKDELKSIDWNAGSKTSSNAAFGTGWGDTNIIDQTILEEPPPPLPPRPETEDDDQDRPYAVAEFDYKGDKDDLDFKVGDVIQLLYRVNEDWLCGRCGLREGMFPQSFIKIVVPLAGESGPTLSSSMSAPLDPVGTSSTSSWSPTPLRDTSKGNLVTALYTFQAETVGDLTIHEGCQVKVTGRLSDDWLFGEYNGMSGQFPSNFVDRIPPGLPQI
ncbi:SH3 domain-containing protein 19-like [Palaemon carinicauda]|uniref:SH3 domain-containing protein 19-like n=1 Tax=Palaemon carinicauda TaxID=392227 RepID=UPI0035B65C0C